MNRHSWTIRTRLALLYGTLFLLSGAALLAVTVLLVQQSLQTQPVSMSVVLQHLAETGQAQPAGATPAASSSPAAPVVPTGADPAGQTQRSLDEPGQPQLADGSPRAEPSAPTRADLLDSYALARDLQADFRRTTLRTLITRGSIALGGLAAVGVLLGWVVAGRTLRPIQQITATARRVADRNLHERIALQGPRDELRELAETFDDMLERLDAAFNGQRRFVANASHELRTPLAISRTLVEVALDQPDASAQLRRLGTALLDVNVRQERLIDGLLTLARAEQSLPDPVPVDLAEVARRVVDATGADVRDAGLEVHADLTSAPMVGEPVLLERLVLNLAQNAVRYNGPGGRVWFGAGPCDRGVRLTVSNTGPVVPPDDVAGLFEPFRRLSVRVGSSQGSGLGLSIVRSIAQAHGGDATAVPRDGGGLSVTVTLPTATRPRGERASTSGNLIDGGSPHL